MNRNGQEFQISNKLLQVEETENFDKKGKLNFSDNKNDNVVNTMIWVTNISPNTKAQDLKNLFELKGRVKRAAIIKKEKLDDALFGLLTMKSEDEAKMCIEYFNNTILCGNFLKVEAGKRKIVTALNSDIFFKNKEANTKPIKSENQGSSSLENSDTDRNNIFQKLMLWKNQTGNVPVELDPSTPEKLKNAMVKSFKKNPCSDNDFICPTSDQSSEDPRSSLTDNDKKHASTFKNHIREESCITDVHVPTEMSSKDHSFCGKRKHYSSKQDFGEAISKRSPSGFISEKDISLKTFKQKSSNIYRHASSSISSLSKHQSENLVQRSAHRSRDILLANELPKGTHPGIYGESDDAIKDNLEHKQPTQGSIIKMLKERGKKSLCHPSFELKRKHLSSCLSKSTISKKGSQMKNTYGSFIDKIISAKKYKDFHNRKSYCLERRNRMMSLIRFGVLANYHKVEKSHKSLCLQSSLNDRPFHCREDSKNYKSHQGCLPRKSENELYTFLEETPIYNERKFLMSHENSSYYHAPRSSKTALPIFNSSERLSKHTSIENIPRETANKINHVPKVISSSSVVEETRFSMPKDSDSPRNVKESWTKHRKYTEPYLENSHRTIFKVGHGINRIDSGKLRKASTCSFKAKTSTFKPSSIFKSSDDDIDDCQNRKYMRGTQSHDRSSPDNVGYCQNRKCKRRTQSHDRRYFSSIFSSERHNGTAHCRYLYDISRTNGRHKDCSTKYSGIQHKQYGRSTEADNKGKMLKNLILMKEYYKNKYKRLTRELEKRRSIRNQTKRNPANRENRRKEKLTLRKFMFKK